MKTIWRNAHKVKRNGSQLETRKHRRDRKCDEYWDFSIRRVIDKLGEKSLIYRHNKKNRKRVWGKRFYSSYYEYDHRERSTRFIKRVLDCAVVTRIQELDQREEEKKLKKRRNELQDVDRRWK
jgi:hypothetical protein